MTPKSAKERHRVMSNKFGWNAKPGGDGDSPIPKTPSKKPTAGGVTKRAGRVGDSAKKGKGKKAAVQEDEGSADGESEMDNGDV